MLCQDFNFSKLLIAMCCATDVINWIHLLQQSGKALNSILKKDAAVWSVSLCIQDVVI